MNILLVEIIVLITIGWATTLYSWNRKWLRQRHAWQWWHDQQASQAHCAAEFIRDGLLQQTFAFRRYLESVASGEVASGEVASGDEIAAATVQSDPEQATRCLERLQTLYQSLESLSDQLSPPFIADSLPLALQFAVRNWQHSQAPSSPAQAPVSDIQFSFPPDWPRSSPHQNQNILSVVAGLLPLLLPQGHTTQQLKITLAQEGKLNALVLQLRNAPAETTSNISELTEIQHLKEIFHSLAAGQLEIRQVETLLIGRLCWRDP